MEATDVGQGIAYLQQSCANSEEKNSSKDKRRTVPVCKKESYRAGGDGTAGLHRSKPGHLEGQAREGGRDRRRIKIEDPGHGNPTQTYIIEIVNVIAIVNCLVNNKPGPMSCCSFDAMETALLCILDLLAVCPSVAPHEEERFTHAIKPTKPSGFWNVLAG